MLYFMWSAQEACERLVGGTHQNNVETGREMGNLDVQLENRENTGNWHELLKICFTQVIYLNTKILISKFKWSD